MSGLVVDTSVWIDYFRGDDFPFIDRALKNGIVILPAVVAAELLSGVNSTVEAAELKDFVSTLKWHGLDEDHWCRVGLLRSKLRKKGYHVSTPDAHVAQCSLDLKMPLATGDAIFKKISKIVGLKLV